MRRTKPSKVVILVIIKCIGSKLSGSNFSMLPEFA